MKKLEDRYQRSADKPPRKGHMIDPLKSLAVGLDAWRALKGGPPAIHARQQKRLRKLISHARQSSPYFRNLYAGLPQDTTDLLRLPPTDKATLMENFDGWVTDPAVTRAGIEAFLADKSLAGSPFLGKYLVWTSSGTSGIPAAFVQDRQALAVMTAMSLMRGPAGPRDLMRILMRGNRQAGLYGTGGHLQGVAIMGHRMRNSPGWATKIAGFSVLTPLPELVRQLNDFQPSVFGGYASTLSLLAEEKAAGRLRVNPAMIVSGAEAISPEARERVAAAFGCPVRDYYGTSEASGLTYECRYGWLHVNADWFVLEPVDQDYQPTPPGEVSHTVLLTNLANHLQPIIRYDLGDRIALKPEPCACGSPLPAVWVEGRRNELLAFPADGDGRSVSLPPRAIAAVIDFTPGVKRCQAIKTGERELKVRLEVEAGADEGRVWAEAKRRLEEYLAGQGLSGVEVGRDGGKPGIDPRTGKFRHVWSEVEEARATW